MYQNSRKEKHSMQWVFCKQYTCTISLVYYKELSESLTKTMGIPQCSKNKHGVHTCRSYDYSIFGKLTYTQVRDNCTVK